MAFKLLLIPSIQSILVRAGQEYGGFQGDLHMGPPGQLPMTKTFSIVTYITI